MHPYDKNQPGYRMMDINESQNCLAIVSAVDKTTQQSGFI